MRIDFEYSTPYDRMLTIMSMGDYSDVQKDAIKSYIYDLEKSWKVDEKRILGEIESVSGLKFKKNDIICYVVKNMADYAISHPLTMKVEKNLERASIVLIHELIHILFVQNKKSEKLIGYLSKNYGEHNLHFRVHLPLFIVQRKVIENLYGKNYFTKVLRTELKLEEGYIWRTANEIYPKFKKDIIKFFKC